MILESSLGFSFLEESVAGGEEGEGVGVSVGIVDVTLSWKARSA